MGKGTAFGKTILIGDSFVLNEVPAIVSAIPFETEAIVERIDGEGWMVEDHRIEVPGYIAKKKAHHLASIKRILKVMQIDTTFRHLSKITLGRVFAGRQRCRGQCGQLRVPGPGPGR